METTIVKVTFEFTDAHQSICDNEDNINKIEKRAKKLCNVFDFKHETQYKKLDSTPHIVFHISFNKNVVTFHHYMNVLAAFAQEFQILISAAREERL